MKMPGLGNPLDLPAAEFAMYLEALNDMDGDGDGTHLSHDEYVRRAVGIE